MSKLLNIYKISRVFGDGLESTEYIVAIVRAETENDAIRVLVEDDTNQTRKVNWSSARIDMIGWSTGERIEEVICIADG